MVDHCHIDFETRSVVDLRKCGLDIYSKHAGTEVLCMGYAFNDGPVEMWARGQQFPVRVLEHIAAGKIIVAHNAPFEIALWNNSLFVKKIVPIKIKLDQISCTMARAYAMGLPGSLKNLAAALNVPAQKDLGGHALMLKLCKPRSFDDNSKPIYWEDESMMARLRLYCAQDVEAERQCDRLMVPLSPAEQKVWVMDQEINQRGIGVDRDAIKKTQTLVDKVKKKLNLKMRDFTGGVIGAATEAGKILAWCQAYGVEIKNLKKRELEDWLDEPDLPYEVREVLEIRSDGAKSSISKLQTALDMSLSDGRLRGMFQYHGATTGRFAARGVQLHNLPRPEKPFSDPNFQANIIKHISNAGTEELIEEFHGPFLRVIVSCLRGFLVSAVGYDFVGADLANIEGRVLAWLAGEEWKIKAFRDFDAKTGPDLYILSAIRIYKLAMEQIDDFKRLIGKVCELALGYQGAKGAFHSMSANYGTKVSDEEAQGIVDAWREAHPATVSYWYDVERAAMAAVRAPGAKIEVGAPGRKVAFRIVGNFLWLQLPSKRCLCYPFPEIQMVKTSWGKDKEAVTFMGVDGRVNSPTKGKFVRLSSYGGKFVENITQAVARDILVEAWPRLEAAGYPIVLHVHDENVSEVPEGFGSVKEYEEIMSILPSWAEGLPVKAKGFRGKRYRK